MTPEIENEQLRTRLAEMAAEVERLQSVIDAANAQEPFGYSCGDWLFKEKGQFDSYSAAYMVGNKPEEKTAVAVYARPIPAQQSPAVAVQICEECDIANCIHVRDKTMQIIANPSELEMHRMDYNAIKSAGFESPGELLAAYNHLLSNRITEQDAREIAKSFEDFADEGESAYEDSSWRIYMNWTGSALLDKLNGDKNAQ